jgi:trans-aconitate 2-methyltransferase
MRWDPAQYARFADHRSRPFVDLVAQVRADDPAVVVDLGCGSGELTATLAERWPAATVRGVDSSAEMIAQAPPGDFSVGTAQDFDATGVDVLVTNAMLQWVPDHEALLRRWCAELNPGGWVALQVPDNFDAPSHALMRELAESETWRAKLDGVLRDARNRVEPEAYQAILLDAGFEADVWQTDYLHLLQGDDPVLEWVRGTGLRPVLAALSAQDAAAFEETYAGLLRDAYPRGPHGTVFPFRRTFAVGRKG